MSDFNQLQQQFAQDLISSVSDTAQQKKAELGDSGPDTQLNALINSFPFYTAPDWSAAHRGALANLAGSQCPNNGIAAQPNDNGPWYAPYFSSYSYNGPFSGYANAFFTNQGQSSTAAQVLAQVQAVNGGLNGGWWGNYAVTLLTDAVRQTISVGLDSNKLSTDLTNNFNTFKPALAASYLAVFTSGYAPTMGAMQAITSAGQQAQACQLLDSALKSGRFSANINQAIATGGDSSIAATWFLFNTWIALKALGCTNVDQAIGSYQSAGLSVPPEVGPQNWWNGTYSGWFVVLSGSDVMNTVRNTITANMPESEMTVYPSTGEPSFPVTNNTSASNGYSYSLCNWGSLNWYNPQSSSCFGAGTQVLMADGSTKPIEEVCVNDVVYTQLGPRKVVLCEQPERDNRRLYAINGLNLSVTSAHPFFCAGNDARYCAIEPWALIDGIPTFAPAGVATLKPGLRLLAWDNGSPGEISVERVEQQEAPKADSKEYVYDLLLENWERDHPAYFVGGPSQFIAAAAETVDPLHDPAASIAIITALELATATSREYVSTPAAQIPAILKNIDLAKVAGQARKLSKLYLAGKTFERPSIPDQSFYLYQDRWDPHAALLDHYLAGYFGRWMRAEVQAGWRHQYTGNDGEVWLLDIHDIELINQPFPAGQSLTLALDLSDAGLNDVSYTTDLLAAPTWSLRLDETLELGESPQKEVFSLYGKISTADGMSWQFHLHSSVRNPQQNVSDLFLFTPGGDIVGRIAVSLRTVSREQRLAECENRGQWKRRDKHTYAYALGRQLGLQIQAAMEANSHHV